MNRIACLAMLALLAAPAAARDKQRSSIERMLGGGPMLDAKDLAKAVERASAFPLGSKENPVRAEMPMGQRAYLARLRCSDGKPPRFERIGNFGEGVFGSIVDGYAADCGAAAPGKVEIMMDMYHPGHVESGPVPGFAIDTPVVGDPV